MNNSHVINHNDMIEHLKEMELLTYKQLIKSRKKLNIFHSSLVIISVFFLIFDIYFGFFNFGFYVWIFNLIWNSYFYYYNISKNNKDNKKYLLLLKEYKPDVYKQKMRKKQLKKVTKLKFY